VERNAEDMDLLSWLAPNRFADQATSAGNSSKLFPGVQIDRYQENSKAQLLTNYFPKLSAHRIKLYSNRGGRH
jgi:erythromycin esterase-like protein